MIKSFSEFNESINEGFWDWLTGRFLSGKPGEKSQSDDSVEDEASDSDLESFYKTLESIASSGKQIEVKTGENSTYSKAVQNIQIALKFLGYSDGEANGIFGKETAEAILRFNNATASIF